MSSWLETRTFSPNNLLTASRNLPLFVVFIPSSTKVHFLNGTHFPCAVFGLDGTTDLTEEFRRGLDFRRLNKQTSRSSHPSSLHLFFWCSTICARLNFRQRGFWRRSILLPFAPVRLFLLSSGYFWIKSPSDISHAEAKAWDRSVLKQFSQTVLNSHLEPVAVAFARRTCFAGMPICIGCDYDVENAAFLESLFQGEGLSYCWASTFAISWVLFNDFFRVGLQSVFENFCEYFVS